jgi:TatD DNase family protein
VGLFDVHAHLTHPTLLADITRVLADAEAAGVSSIVSNGLNIADNQQVLALAARFPCVKPALGLYPVDAVLPEMRALGVPYPREFTDEPDAEASIAWLREHIGQAFAVGEVGLDGYWVPEPLWERQEEAFRALVKLAVEADKALILHTRKRERRAFEIVRELSATRVDFHCFGGKVKLAREIAEAGYHLSIPANARRSESFTRMLQTLPRERILLETDCPYLAPERDGSSSPAHVRGTLAYAAELWQVSEAEAEAQLADNFTALFGVAP